MKHSLFVHQKAVFDAALIGKVTVEGACLLSYLHGWQVHPKANSVTVEGLKFVWLDYGNAVAELPMLFNPEAGLASRKNKLARQMQKFRDLGLLETKLVAGRLYFRLSVLGQRLAYSGKKSAATASQTVTPNEDEAVPSGHDEAVTSKRDEYLPAIIDEPSIRETRRSEPPPQSPSEGMEDEVIAFWNSFPRLPSTKALTSARARRLRARLADPFWRAHWREAIPKIADNPFMTGGGERGWRADFDWFLRSDSVARILEGKYDPRTVRPRKLSIMELNARLKAIEGLMKEHSGNDNNFCENYEDRNAFEKLKLERQRIQEQLAKPPEA